MNSGFPYKPARQGHRSDPVDQLLSRLDGVRRNGDNWSAHCPAHNDRRPSLAIARGADGRALVHCHAGCGPSAILNALGLAFQDLFAQSPDYQEGRRRDG